MRRRWRPWGRFIPSELGLDASERRAVLKDAEERWLLDRRNGLWCIVWMLGAMGGMVLAVWVLPRSAQSAGVGVGVIGGWALFSEWRARSLRPFIYAALRGRGHDVCRGCGYLRGGLGADEVCPECGVRSAPLAAH